MKTCVVCNTEKPFECFHKNRKYTYDSRCKACKKEIAAMRQRDKQFATDKAEKLKLWRKNNPNYTREWNQKNRESRLKSRKGWRIKNPKYETIKYQTDSYFRLQNLLRGRLKIALRRKYKSGSAVRDLGMPISAFLTYLNLDCMDKYGVPYTGNESRFHLDHIKPLSSFDLTDRNQLLIACNWANIQVLTVKENLSKGAKLL